MIVNKKISTLLSAVALVATFSMHGVFNLSNFYEPYFRPNYNSDSSFQISLIAEKAINEAKGFNSCGNSVDVLQIYNPTENSLKMLKGFDESTPQNMLCAALDASDDGTRGHFCVTGCMEHRFSFGLSGRYALPHNFFIGAYLPVHSLELKNVCWQDQTEDVSQEDALVKELLTNDIFENVKKLGGRELGGWTRTGVGDLTILGEWIRDFKQDKPLLKNARLSCRFGIGLPTGKRADEDLLAAFSFSHDGALGVIFGAGLGLTLGEYMHAGFDVEVTHMINNTRNRRIKTDECQTEHLLLAKACMHKDWGLQQRFNLYCGLHENDYGLSCDVYYQFLKKGESVATLSSKNHPSAIANTSVSLQESMLHNVIVKATYTRDDDDDSIRWARPSVSFFAKIPFRGTRAIQFTTLGALLSIDF